MRTPYLILISVLVVCSCAAVLMYFFTSTPVPQPAIPTDTEPIDVDGLENDMTNAPIEISSTTEVGTTSVGVDANENEDMTASTPTEQSGAVGSAPKTPVAKPVLPSKPQEAGQENGDGPKPAVVSKPTPTPTPTPSVIQSAGDAEWGVYVGYSAGELSAFEQLVGQTADIRGVFVNWNDPFPSSFSSLKSSGKTMLIYWELYGGVSLDSIIAGEHDAYIKEFARGAQSYGGKVILAPMHEMNGNWDPWGGTVGSNTPEKVVSAWKHIYTTFGSVSNVKFGWAVNSISVPNTAANAIERYYPGDAYVDYVGVDGFNFGSPWESFDEVFSDALTRVRKYNKPVYIFSMASAEGTQKDEWIYDFAQKMSKYDIVGWVWFNEDKERDWRVNSDAASLAAFKAILP